SVRVGWDGGDYERAEAWGLQVGDHAQWNRTGGEQSPLYRRFDLMPTAYDAQRRRLVVFRPPDLWSYSIDVPRRWQLLPRGDTTPPFTRGFAMSVDPVRDRLVVLGGESSSD